MLQNNYSIRKAELHNLIEVLYIYRTCVIEMNRRGFFNWNSAYPSREQLFNDIHAGNLFIYIENYTVLGVVCLNEEEPEEYKNLKFNQPEKALYVHRLAVHPEFMNNKIGSKMMSFASEYGKNHGFKSVRLDVICSNPSAIKLYTNSGYEKIGEIFFDYQKDPFIVYERFI